MNVTHTDCLTTTNDIGRHVVHNICTGATIDIPWGTADWLIAILAAGACVTGMVCLYKGYC